MCVFAHVDMWCDAVMLQERGKDYLVEICTAQLLSPIWHNPCRGRYGILEYDI